MDREFGQPNPYSTGTNLCFIDVTKSLREKVLLCTTLRKKLSPSPVQNKGAVSDIVIAPNGER